MERDSDNILKMRRKDGTIPFWQARLFSFLLAVTFPLTTFHFSAIHLFQTVVLSQDLRCRRPPFLETDRQRDSELDIGSIPFFTERFSVFLY